MNVQAAQPIVAEPDAQAAWLHKLGAPEGGARGAAAWILAALMHAGLVGLALDREPPPRAIARVTEVELQRPLPPPIPAPLPPAEPQAPKPEAAPQAPRSRAHAPAAKPVPKPAPAAAAPLRTVDETVKTAEEPVRFVTDPNGTAFGYGTVARGGTGSGAPGAQLPEGPEPSLAAAPGTPSAPALSRPPSLDELEPCRGFFPERAQADRGEVALKVRVEADGKVRSVTIARESPSGQGFGFAARECLMSKRFSPALDKAGQPVAVVSPVTIRFSR
ncbi:MAG TPA: TonB family protein [Polyangiales bacterium]